MVADAFDAAGWDIVIVETVGVGQAEIDIAGLAQQTIVVCAPGFGDVVQGIKAGIMEIADVLVLNKTDLPNAEAAVRQLAEAIAFMPEPARPMLMQTSAKANTGVAALADVVVIGRETARIGSDAERLRRVRRLVLAFATQKLQQRLDGDAAEAFGEICGDLLEARLDFEDAAAKTLALGV